MTIEQIARVCHEANAAYCRAMGDITHVGWDDAPEWQRESAMEGVLFLFNHPDAGPSACHENWLKTKEADGWAWGPIKDPDLKQHPCIVPFSRLPAHQRAKDYIFSGIVHAFMALEKGEHNGGTTERQDQQREGPQDSA